MLSGMLEAEATASDVRVIWRRGGDSNSRSSCELAGFQDRCNQPLCHLSVAINSTTYAHSIRRPRDAGPRRRRRTEHAAARVGLNDDENDDGLGLRSCANLQQLRV